MLFSHQDRVRVHIKMTLLGIELGTLEVKGEWSDHYTTEAPATTCSVTGKTHIKVKPIFELKSLFIFWKFNVPGAIAFSTSLASSLSGR